MTAIDEYVRQVMDHIPYASPERGRIEIDVRAHLEETVAAEGSVGAAVGRMGAPREVALAYLTEVPRPLASLFDRTIAFLIDFVLGLVVVVAGLALMALTFFPVARAVEGEALPIAALGFEAILIITTILSVTLLSLAYFPVLEWRFGQTLGKYLMGLHVIKEDGARISLLDAIVRRIPFFLEFFWIDGIVALFTERKQRAFDLVARTLVVECRPTAGVAMVAADPSGNPPAPVSGGSPS